MSYMYRLCAGKIQENRSGFCDADPAAARERSKKTEAVFLVASRGLRGEIRNPTGRFFSFANVFFFGGTKKKMLKRPLAAVSKKNILFAVCNMQCYS